MTRGRNTKQRVTSIKRSRQAPASDSQPGYPPLKEHLLTRRDALTFVGAALVTGLGPACIGGDSGEPMWDTYRLPREGDTTIPLSGGGAIRCYFNAVASWSDFRADLALSALQEDLATRTYFELSHVYYGGDPEALRALELELEASIEYPGMTYELEVQRGSLVITILELAQ